MDRKSLEHLRDVLVTHEDLLDNVFADFAGVGEFDAQHEKEVQAHEQAMQLVMDELVQHSKRSCPILLDPTGEVDFLSSQKFVVRFSRRSNCEYDGIKIMTLDDLDDMVAHMRKTVFPFDLYYNEFEWEQINNASDLWDSFVAWPIPVGWRKPSYFPVYSHLGYFPDWEVWDTKEDED